PAPGLLEQIRAPRMDGLVLEETLEILRQLLGRRVALLRRLGQSLQNDGLQLDRQGFIEASRRTRLIAVNLPKKFLPIFSWKDGLQCQEFVKGRTQAVDIGAQVDQSRSPLRLFGTHVTQRTEQVAGLGQAGFALASGQSE